MDEQSARTHWSKSYHFAVACGAVPLVTGVSIFLLWVPTRWPILETAGVITIAVGLVLFSIGVAALGWFAWSGRGDGDAMRLQRRNMVLACGALLLANFPACVAIGMAVSALESMYTLTVHNHLPRVVEQVRVFGIRDLEIGPLAEGAATTRRFWVRGEGDLRLGFVVDGQESNTVIEGYTGAGAACIDVTLEPNGTVRVEREATM